jgi:hypothetical protein
MDSISESFKTIDLSNCVPFSLADIANTPRYLFHVYDCKTKGTTDEKWVKSLDALNNDENHMDDVFKRLDRSEVARGLNEHLRWSSPTSSGKNNFVSWTDSLPFAIAYAIYRHRFKDLKIPLTQIFLCAVDTSMLPAGVFIKDMDLMEAYRDDIQPNSDIKIFLKGKWELWSKRGLPNLIDLRNSYNGGAYYYFGEYLSQGKLKIEGACTIIPFHKIINKNLYLLYPGFKEALDGDRIEWAKPVMNFRREIYDGPPKSTTLRQVQAVIAITDNIEPQWKLAITAELFALLGSPKDDQELLNVFRNHFTGEHTILQFRDCSDQQVSRM